MVATQKHTLLKKDPQTLLRHSFLIGSQNATITQCGHFSLVDRN